MQFKKKGTIAVASNAESQKTVSYCELATLFYGSRL